jgi:hypothetical protein
MGGQLPVWEIEEDFLQEVEFKPIGVGKEQSRKEQQSK